MKLKSEITIGSTTQRNIVGIPTSYDEIVENIPTDYYKLSERDKYLYLKYYLEQLLVEQQRLLQETPRTPVVYTLHVEILDVVRAINVLNGSASDESKIYESKLNTDESDQESSPED